jgi:hypothetical protein
MNQILDGVLTIVRGLKEKERGNSLPVNKRRPFPPNQEYPSEKSFREDTRESKRNRKEISFRFRKSAVRQMKSVDQTPL